MRKSNKTLLTMGINMYKALNLVILICFLSPISLWAQDYEEEWGWPELEKQIADIMAHPHGQPYRIQQLKILEKRGNDLAGIYLEREWMDFYYRPTAESKKQASKNKTVVSDLKEMCPDAADPDCTPMLKNTLALVHLHGLAGQEKNEAEAVRLLKDVVNISDEASRLNKWSSMMLTARRAVSQAVAILGWHYDRGHKDHEGRGGEKRWQTPGFDQEKLVEFYLSHEPFEKSGLSAAILNNLGYLFSHQQDPVRLSDNMERARGYFELAAREHNHPQALGNLGWLYEAAAAKSGLKKDLEEAADLYYQASIRGEPVSQANLGRLLSTKKVTRSKAKNSNGNQPRKYSLGSAPNEKHDLAEALWWYQLSANQGYGPGQHLLADLYANKAQRYEMAAYYYLAGQEKFHNAFAQRESLATSGSVHITYSDDGHGPVVKPGQKSKESEYNLLKSFASSDNDLMTAIDPTPKMLLQDSPYEEVINWFLKAAGDDVNDFRAQYNLSVILEHGWGQVEADPQKAAIWLMKSLQTFSRGKPVTLSNMEGIKSAMIQRNAAHARTMGGYTTYEWAYIPDAKGALAQAAQTGSKNADGAQQLASAKKRASKEPGTVALAPTKDASSLPVAKKIGEWQGAGYIGPKVAVKTARILKAKKRHSQPLKVATENRVPKQKFIVAGR